MVQKDKKDLKKEDGEFLALLYNKCPIIKETEEYIGRFKKLFEAKQQGTLKKWIDDVSKSTSGIRSFANACYQILMKVNNVTPYSNGQVEGQVNRLKNIKRRMYGKAGFELLRRIVIFKSG